MDSGTIRRFLALVRGGVVVYLGWRIVGVVADPSVASAAFLVVEALAWLGVEAFLLRVSPPRHPTAVESAGARPSAVVAVLAAGCPLPALERSLLSLAAADPDRVLVVDDAGRDDDSRASVRDTVAAAGASLVFAAGADVHAAMDAVRPELGETDAVVVLQSGSLLAAGALDELLEPLRDPSVGAVQGGIGWSDESTLTLHGPSRDGLKLLMTREQPAAGAAGVAVLLADGTALRARALDDVARSTGDLGVALAAAGWTARFAVATVAVRPRPASAAGWRRDRTTELAASLRRAHSAFAARGLGAARRLRMMAGAGDLASAFARVGLVGSLVAALITGVVPLPGSLRVTLPITVAMWALAALATRVAVAPVLRFGDRTRLGWHRLDADVLALFATRRAPGPGHRGGLRALAWFPVSVVALLAIDGAGIFRGLALVHPDIAASMSPTARIVVGGTAAAVVVLLFDALRVFVARPDARDDARVRTGLVGALVLSDVEAAADIVDLSPTGARVVTHTPARRGDLVRLRFVVPGSAEPLDLDATVTRVVDDGDVRSIGVKFGLLSPNTRRDLVRYVVTTAPAAASARAHTAPLPGAAIVPVPRAFLRFVSVIAVVVTSVSLAVAPAGAESASGGVVSGTVSDASGPVAHVCVSAVTDSWQWFGTQTDDSGGYSLPIPAGNYRLQFRDCRSDATERLVTGWWSPSGLVDQNTAATFAVADATTVADHDATMTPGGWFQGTVVDPNGAPADGICINPVSVATNSWDGGTTTPTNGGPTGSFATDAMAPGQYRIHVNDCSGQTQPYAQAWIGADGTSLVPLQNDAKAFDLATAPIDLGAITMRTGTRLAGTVHDDTGAPVGGICVAVEDQSWNWVAGAQTAPDGTYSTDPVLPGSWVLSFDDCRPGPTLVNSFWGGASPGTGTGTVTDIAAATPIAIDGSTPLQGGYDQTLPRGGTLSGTVTAGGAPVAGACVSAVVITGDNGQWIGGTNSAPDGSFTIGPILGQNVAVSVDQCQSSAAVLSGVYAGPGNPPTRNPASAVTFTVGPDVHVTGLAIDAQLGATLSGRVTGAGAPLENACVSVLDPGTGYPESRRTGPDGTWSVTVPPGSYLVEALDCVPGRGFAGRFAANATDPAQATAIVATGGQTTANVDVDLPAGTPTSIHGRIVTGAGSAAPGCAVAVTPNQDPFAVVGTHADGSFDLGPLNPGAYLVAFAGCDFTHDLPPGITDPDNPAVVYPLQWSSGTSLDVNNLWQHPSWVTAPSGTAAELGTICLSPCNRPAPPSTTTTTAGPPPTAAGVTTPTTATSPGASTPAATTPSVTTTPAPAPSAPSAAATPHGTLIALFAHRRLGVLGVRIPPALPTWSSFTQQAQRSIAPPPSHPGHITVQTAADAGTGNVAGEHVTQLDRVRSRVAPLAGVQSPPASDSSQWWWLFAAAAAAGLLAAAIPWRRRVPKTRDVSARLDSGDGTRPI